MRVAMFVDWFFPYTAGIANALADRAEVLMVVREHGQELGITEGVAGAMRSLIDDRVGVAFLGGKQRDPWSAVHVERLSSVLLRFRPDVLHIQYHADWRLFALERVLRGVPTLYTVHDVVLHPTNPEAKPSAATRIRHSLLGTIVRGSRGPANAYVVHGQHLADLMRMQEWYNDAPINVIPHGTFPYGTSNKPLPQRPTILFFGRIEYYKGLDILIEAAELASASLPDLGVIIAGRGDDAARCRRLVTKPGFFEWREGYVRYDRLGPLFSEASIVVLPYREASQSGVIPLALQFGRAVIATDVGALSEAVDDGRDGILLRHVSAESLCCAMVRVLSDREALTRLSNGAFDTVTTGRLKPERIGDLHLEACRRVVSSSKRAPVSGSAS